MIKWFVYALNGTMCFEDDKYGQSFEGILHVLQADPFLEFPFISSNDTIGRIKTCD